MSAKLNANDDDDDATLNEENAVDFGGKNVDWLQLMWEVSSRTTRPDVHRH